MNLENRSGEAPLTARRKAEYISLHRAKGRRELGQYLVEGVRAVESAVAAGASIVDVAVTPGARQDARVLGFLGGLGGRILTCSERELAQMSDVKTTQGVLAAARLPEAAARPRRGPCLVLDGVQDPGNVGTLIRTAAWFGSASVVCGPGTADPFQPKVVRAAMGGLWDLDVLRVDSLEPLLEEARANGVPVYIADAGGQPASAWHPARESVLVIGSEARGPSAAVLSLASGLVSLPRLGAGHGTESLNAAVAGGILLDRWLSRPSDSKP